MSVETPLLMKSMAVSKPMPVLAPVMTATWPAKDVLARHLPPRKYPLNRRAKYINAAKTSPVKNIFADPAKMNHRGKI